MNLVELRHVLHEDISNFIKNNSEHIDYEEVSLFSNYVKNIEKAKFWEILTEIEIYKYHPNYPKNVFANIFTINLNEFYEVIEKKYHDKVMKLQFAMFKNFGKRIRNFFKCCCSR